VSWAKFDDRYHDNRKVKKAWHAHPRAVGLHAMAITYCAMHETDGLIDAEWLKEKLPAARERTAVLAALVDTGLFEPDEDGGFYVHDYLVFNPERADLEEKRRKDSERKRTTRPSGLRAESERSPDGFLAPRASAPTPAARPVPSRPVGDKSTSLSSSPRNGAAS
jgi:hypothetical protein